jgi:CheY-like chemotaxis protein
MEVNLQDSSMLETISSFICFADEVSPRPIGFGSDRSVGKAPQSTRLKVLVVDDEKLIADTVCEILKGAGFDVVAAYDGWTALEVARRFRPDHLLSDVLMPKMNGVDLAITIQQMYPTARIVLFSGQAGISEILLDGQRRGLKFDLIAKPIHPLKLIERLKDHE